jgi:hypothetical protein
MEYNDKSHRLTPKKEALYLQSKSVTINYYHKYSQLIGDHPSCPNIEASRNVIRLEVQCKYPKVYSMSKDIRYDSKLYKDMASEELFTEIMTGQIITNPIDVLLTDDIAFDVVRKYYNRIIGRGDYYTLATARTRVQSERFHPKVKERLIEALELVNRCRGITKARATLHGGELIDFERSLKDLQKMGLNPVTIPRTWGIPHIKNLFDAYLDMVADHHCKERMEEANKELLREHYETKRRNKH